MTTTLGRQPPSTVAEPSGDGTLTRQPAAGALRPFSLAMLAAVGAFVGWLWIAADGLARHAWGPIDVGQHLVGAFSLQTAVGALFGVVVWAMGACISIVARSLPWPRARAESSMRPLLCAVLAAVLSWRTTAWLAGWPLGPGGLAPAGSTVGPLARVSAQAVWQSGLGALLVGVSCGVAVWWVQRACGALQRPVHYSVIATATGCGVLAMALAYVDLTVYVALYSRLHEWAEVAATLLAMTGAAMALAMASRRWRWVGRSVRALALLVIGWAVILAGSQSLQGRAAEALAHTQREPVLLGRSLVRAQSAAAFLADPASWRGARVARLKRVLDRYDIASATLHPKWALQPPGSEAAAAPSGPAPTAGAPFNLVVFYVDTLRHDAASDPTIMPHLTRLSESSLRFKRAYSSAPDTVGALPVVLTGNYGPMAAGEQNLLALAHQASVRTALVVAKSAGRFLAKHLPTFEFDDRIEVVDYEPGASVWGYGADQPTADRIVDEALGWLEAHRNEPFLLWMFHYDVHNWRELDRDYVYSTAERLGVPDSARLNWRYRVAAAGVDAELPRLLRALEDLNLAERTVVLVMSDHGEGLGYRGHWVHSVFLWDSLIHVPLLLRVPGVSPAIVETPVGHADLYATLVDLVVPSASVGSTHGESLLGRFAGQAPRNRWPILLRSSHKDTLLRVGIIDREKGLKLVLPLEADTVELYDLASPGSDDVELSARRRADALRLLNELVQSPYFPHELVQPAAEPAAQ